MRGCRVVTKLERPKRERRHPAAPLPPSVYDHLLHARTHTLKRVFVCRCCLQHRLFFRSRYSGAGVAPAPLLM